MSEIYWTDNVSSSANYRWVILMVFKNSWGKKLPIYTTNALTTTTSWNSLYSFKGHLFQHLQLIETINMATLPFLMGWGAQDWLVLIYSLRWFEFWQKMWCFAVAVSVCWLNNFFFLMPTASAQQYKSTIAFYCHSLPAQDCVCVSYRLVNLKTSFVICQKPSGHISCSSLPSVSQKKREIHLWLCGNGREPACILLWGFCRGWWRCGGWAVCFPFCAIFSGTMTASCRIPGQSYSSGNCIGCSGDCGTAWNQSSAHLSAFPFSFLAVLWLLIIFSLLAGFWALLLLLAAWVPTYSQSHHCPYQPKEATSGKIWLQTWDGVSLLEWKF